MERRPSLEMLRLTAGDKTGKWCLHRRRRTRKSQSAGITSWFTAAMNRFSSGCFSFAANERRTFEPS